MKLVKTEHQKHALTRALSFEMKEFVYDMSRGALHVHGCYANNYTVSLISLSAIQDDTLRNTSSQTNLNTACSREVVIAQISVPKCANSESKRERRAS